MKKSVIILLMLLAISCRNTSIIEGGFLYDGIERSWIIYLPGDYRSVETLPLLIALHGHTQTAEEIMKFSGFNAVADTGRFIVVYPDGVDKAWNVGFIDGSKADDIGFISAMIDTLYKQYNIDPDRVYATGMSNGGFMCYCLACELSERIAAIAPVAGTMTETALGNCKPENEVPVMHIHGTDDKIVNYNGEPEKVSVEKTISFWCRINACTGKPVVSFLPDTSNEGSDVEKIVWTDNNSFSSVVLLKIIHGGHTWPGSVVKTGVGNTNRDIKASSEIWNFVNKFSLDKTMDTIKIE